MWEIIKGLCIMIGGFFYALFLIIKFFVYDPWANWFENIRNAESEDKSKVILRGLLIIIASVALIALGVYNNYGSGYYDYERDHYNEYRNEPGW